ncbi:hypothetical protein EVAR_87024_1 [Eumeta japonica]|uniref:Uncharacterized protein n=1 Tax=Eumeta variegata TaxID=151549 RepID=A0A4C1Z5F9_EUMVA|nr:hypothetical protein EVAR_87024_1 [Eumeta japonica]
MTPDAATHEGRDPANEPSGRQGSPDRQQCDLLKTIHEKKKLGCHGYRAASRRDACLPVTVYELSPEVCRAPPMFAEHDRPPPMLILLQRRQTVGCTAREESSTAPTATNALRGASQPTER